jgi:hypothetical protein
VSATACIATYAAVPLPFPIYGLSRFGIFFLTTAIDKLKSAAICPTFLTLSTDLEIEKMDCTHEAYSLTSTPHELWLVVSFRSPCKHSSQNFPSNLIKDEKKNLILQPLSFLLRIFKITYAAHKE